MIVKNYWLQNFYIKKYLYDILIEDKLINVYDNHLK